MKLRTNQTGAAHIIAFLVIVVLAVVAFAGYKVASTNKHAATTAAIVAAPSTLPATLQTKGDVASASNALESTAIDSSVDPGQLDSDLNALL